MFIITAGVYVAATDNGFSSISNLIANFGAVLGISGQNNGELVAVIPLNKLDKESAVVAVKIQNNKSSQLEPKKTETTTAIVSSSEAPVSQNINIENQQLIPEEQPQSVTAPEPASQEPTPQLESAPIPASEPTQQAEPIKVLISEIQAGTTQNGTEDEFIELYNPTNQAIDMSDWSLIKKTSSGSSYNLVSSAKFSGSIASKGFFLVAHTNYKGVKPIDLIYSANSNNISYKDNSVALYDGNDVVIDEVLWSEIPKDKSLERKVLINGVCVSARNENELKGNGCDTDNASDFELREMPNPQNTSNGRE